MNRNHVILLISQIRKNSSAFLEKEMANKGMEGLISSHGSILGALYRNEGKLKMMDISKLIKKDKSTVTYLVNRLQNADYVKKEKSSKDSRETYIVLTEKGSAARENFEPISNKLIQTAYKGFSEDEKDKLMELLERMNKNFT